MFTYKVKEKGLSDQFVIDSFATSTEEIGNPPHRGTVNKLKEVGIPLVPHRAKQITFSDYDNFDYIIGMDSINIKYSPNIQMLLLFSLMYLILLINIPEIFLPVSYASNA